MPSRLAAAQKTIVMTGATRGLGKVAAIELLRDAPEVHLVAIGRPGAAIAGELSEASGNPHVSDVTADLASVGSVRAATARIREDLDRATLPPLAGFIGNAGVQVLRATDASVDGTEMTFAVNVLANHVFIDGLRDHFTAPARIVITTSDTHFGDFKHNLGMVPAPEWRAPSALATPGSAERADGVVAGRTAYATSKLAVVYLVHALARRLPPGVEIFSFNPGLVPGTGLQRDAGGITRFAFSRLMPVMTLTPFARTMQVSGADLAAAAIGPRAGPSGSYINGATVEPSAPASYDPEREEALWDELTRLAERPAVSLAA